MTTTTPEYTAEDYQQAYAAGYEAPYMQVFFHKLATLGIVANNAEEQASLLDLVERARLIKSATPATNAYSKIASDIDAEMQRRGLFPAGQTQQWQENEYEKVAHMLLQDQQTYEGVLLGNLASELQAAS